MDHFLKFPDLPAVKTFLKKWKMENPDLYQYTVCKETRTAITQIFGVL